MTAKAVPQNTGGQEHYCGHCTLGCGAAEKQGPVVSWLPDAQRAGARFVEGMDVQKVLFENVNGVKTAVGVSAIWTSRNGTGGVDGPDSGKRIVPVVVRAKKVIISSGTLWSPIILKRSGLTVRFPLSHPGFQMTANREQNKHIGRNLYLHPVNIVAAQFPTDVRPWEGGILTSVVSSLENLDTHGHGAKLECTVMMPSWCMTFMNWNSGLDYKLQALKYRHMNTFISLARDRDTGRVYPDPETGAPRIEYTPSAFDRVHTMKGALALARIAYTMNATDVHVAIAGTPSFERNPVSLESETDSEKDARFEQWLKTIEYNGNKPPGAIFASAHQMGTNRSKSDLSLCPRLFPRTFRLWAHVLTMLQCPKHLTSVS